MLRVLQERGRSTQTELAALVGLSVASLSERMHKLEARGVIRGYAALVSPEALGAGLLAFVRLVIDSPNYTEAEAAFLDAVAVEPQILECHHVAGEDSYLLKIRTRDTATLSALLAQLKGMQGVTRTNSSIVLQSAKETPALPMPRGDGR